MSQRVHPGIRAVFFDAVGTLLFPEPSALEIYRTLAQRQGFELSAHVIRERFIAAYRLEEDADRAADWVTSEERERNRWHRIVTSTLCEVPDPEACFHELFDHFAKPSAWKVHEEAETVFVKLRERGVVLGVGTNYDSRVWSVLEGIPILAPLLERVVVSAAIGFRKPAAEFLQEAVRRAGCEPSEVLFVGDDRENDHDGALAAGLETVLLTPVSTGSHPPLAAALQL